MKKILVIALTFLLSGCGNDKLTQEGIDMATDTCANNSGIMYIQAVNNGTNNSFDLMCKNGGNFHFIDGKQRIYK